MGYNAWWQVAVEFHAQQLQSLKFALEPQFQVLILGSLLIGLRCFMGNWLTSYSTQILTNLIAESFTQ